MKKTVCMLLILLCLPSCNHKRENIRGIAENPDVHVINVDKAEKTKEMFLSEFCSDIQTIILETTDDILLGRVDIIQVYKDIIFLSDRINTGLYAFNREGKFIRKYGGRGGGPGEYLTVSDFTIDEENEIVYLLDSEMDQIFKYEIGTGKYIGKIIIENNTIDFLFLQYNNERLYAAGNYYRENEIGCMVHEINMSTGKTTQCWLDAKQYNKGWNGGIRRMNESFFYARNQDAFKYVECFMDTIVSFGKDQVTPYVVFKDKDWISQRRVTQLKEDLEKSNFESSSYFSDCAYNVGGYIEWADFILFKYRKKNDKNFVLHHTKTGKTRIANILINDLGFDATKFVNDLICSDAKGMYELIDGWLLERFLERVKIEGYLKKSLDRFEELQNLPEDTNPFFFYYKFK